MNFTSPDGKTTGTVYINRDKTWERRMGSVVVKGTYEVKDDGTTCFTQTEPPPQPEMKQPGCVKIDPHKPGDSWSVKDDKGNEAKFAMTEGRR